MSEYILFDCLEKLVSVFHRYKESVKNPTGRIINEDEQNTPWPAPFKPVVVGSIQLDHHTQAGTPGSRGSFSLFATPAPVPGPDPHSNRSNRRGELAFCGHGPPDPFEYSWPGPYHRLRARSENRAGKIPAYRTQPVGSPVLHPT